MTTEPLKLVPTTRPLRNDLMAVLETLREGQKIRITQTVRVGNREWTTDSVGEFRSIGSLVTGLATERIREDDIMVPTIHFTKENGELSSVTLDENSRLEII